jgi:hypothetical protein
MIATLHRWLAKADAVSESRLLLINVGLACLVAIAHGGALAITLTKPTPDAEGIRQLATISLPIAALVILSAAVALVSSRSRRTVLRLHGVVFVGSAVAMLVWGLGLLIYGIPEGNFSWSVGLFSLWVAYSVFVFCRFTLPSNLRSHPAVFYAPVTAILAAAVVDIGVFLRLMSEMGARFGS